MKYQLRKEKDYNISKWTGGKTKELSIFPGTSKYLDRDFIWRLSSATVELDESDFSKLPDYDRVIMVLEGSVVLTYNDSKTVRLKELEQDSFDGGWKTKSYGRITDFNLMVRKGSDGIVDILEPESEAKAYGDTLHSERNSTTHALYCKEGYFVANFSGNTVMVNTGELLVMEFFDEEPSYTIMGEGRIIRSQIGFDFEYSPEYTAPENAGEKRSEEEKTVQEVKAPEIVSDSEYRGGGFAEDFKWALFLSNTQFRGAKHIFKKIKKLWYDDELNHRVRRLEKIYATFAAYLLGFIIAIYLFMRSGATEGMIIFMIIAWTLIDCLIISPIIYMLALPKPIASHIYDLDKMTEAEKEHMLKRVDKNERLEKILKKYQNSGRNFARNRDDEIE